MPGAAKASTSIIALLALVLVLLVLLHQQTVVVASRRRPAFLLRRCRHHHNHRSPAVPVTMAQAADIGSMCAEAAAAILLMATTEDQASVGLVNALLRRGGWEEHAVPEISEGRVWRRADAPRPLYMWQIQRSFLRSDSLDRQWRAATNIALREMLYLSRHAAASGRPSLTIHPIGNPGQPLPPDGAGSAERAEHGGIPGKVVPPSLRMAPLLRLLHSAVQDAGLDDFEVTLEATHHGPWHGEGTPCCFVEIGSKDEDWGREDAADLWAGVLEQSLGLSEGGRGNVNEPPKPPKAIVVGLGGGHYCPKMNDLVRHRDDVLIGHICASYAFKGPAKAWQAGVLEAVEASKAAVDDSVPVIMYVDKKALPAALRNELLAFLEAEGLLFAVKEHELIEVAERAAGGKHERT